MLFADGYFLSDEESRGPGMVYNHLPKTGGTFTKQIIDNVTPTRDVQIENEFDSLNLEDDWRFKIGGIRNPCEYHVSLYSFGAEGHGGFHRRVPAEYYKANSPEHFKLWLAYIMGGQHVGLLSIRFARSYAHFVVPKSYKEPYIMMGEQDARTVKDAIDSFNISSLDCWIRTENIVQNLAACLKTYEKFGGTVKWNKFQDAQGTAYHTASTHMACSKFFADIGTESLVREGDGQLFEKFGYASCCES